MSEMITSLLREAIEELSRDDVQPNLRLAAERIADSFDDDTRYEATVMFLISGARDRWRVRGLDRERVAEQRGVRSRPVNHKSAAEIEDVRRQRAERKRRAIAEILNEYEDMLEIEWGVELLQSGFALPDGTVKTWGEATVSDHEVRVEMLSVNAVRNIETAARHNAAIKMITSAGARTLVEALTKGE